MKKNSMNGMCLHWYVLRKAFFAMKLTALIFLITTLSLMAGESYSQETRISLNMRNVQIKDVLLKIENSSEYFFIYNNQLIDVDRNVSINVNHEKISEVLHDIFQDQPVEFQVAERKIVIAPVGNKGQQAPRSVSGKVTDSSGGPLPGVSVVIKSTTSGTITDANGNYTLTNVPANSTLQFSFVGMKSQDVAVGKQSTVSVSLVEESIGLDEVVAVGYGTQKKVNLTGAVSQVSFNKLESRPVANVGQALQGVIPNLNVSIANGSPNTAPQLNVRGGTSFSLDKNDGQFKFVSGSPLVLVDGIEMDINQLNPEDIESVSVLKDASSAAVYGSRAAFGVMLVTTKKGKKNEKAHISYDNSFQWNSPTAIPDLLDNYTIQEAANKALLLENKSVSSDMLTRLDMIKAYNADPKNVAPYYMVGGNINWIANLRPYDLALLRNSPMQKHNINLNGGSEKSAYYASIGYQSQDGLYKINTDKYTRYNALMKVSSEVKSWMSVDFKSSYNFSKYSQPVSPAGKGGWWTAMSQEPARNINMPMKTPANSPVGEMYTDNILSFMDYGSSDVAKKENVQLQVSPTITPVKGWKISADFSFRSQNDDRKYFVPELKRVDNSFTTFSTVYTSPTYVENLKEHVNQYTINAFSDYTFKMNKHDFYVLAGFNQEWYAYSSLNGKAENLITPTIPFMSQTMGKQYATDGTTEWATRGGFYRFTYNYDGKYLFESNGRYDGSSRFPTNSRFRFYPSFSGAWRVSKENFAQPFTAVVSDLKLRASYGSLGNQNVSNYIYIPSYTTVLQENQLFNGLRGVGVISPGLISPDLTWETAATIDFGGDLTLWERLELSYDWYNRTTSNILVAGDKFPAVLGASAPTKNSGTLKTNGWEFSAKWRDNLKNGFNYDVMFTVSDYQSKITSFNGNPNKLLSTLYAGQKMGEIWGYETVGTFQTQADITAAPSQSQLFSGVWYPGDIQYKDLNTDSKIGPGANTLADPGDRKVIGNNIPHLQFGLNMNASYKGFDMNIFFQGVGKRDIWIGDQLFWGAIANGGATGTWDVYNNSWTPERTDALYPAYKNKSANILPQTKYLQNAAYIRLKNVTLGYTLPKALVKKAAVSNLRVYVSTFNIWSYSKLPGIFDPELLSANYPMTKSIAFGVQLGL